MTLIFITHNLRLAFGVGDRIAVMYAGRILEEADPGAVLHAPRHPYTLGLLLAEPPITHARAELRGIPGRVPSPDEVADRCAFMDRCEWAQPVCGRGRPELKLVSASRRSACVRVAEIANVLEDRRSAADAVRTVGPRGTEAPPVLRITALRKTYTSVPLIGQRRSVVAVDDIDLDIGARESVGLIGESGSGKTTIARCVLGLNQPTSGSIQLADVEVSDYRRLTRDQIRHVRHAVQCVFQDPYASLNPAYTVEETLREAIAVGGQRPLADPSALLDLVGLSALFRRRRPATLSGGERQRVAIARAIAVGPRLLLCDEPVAALDVSVQAQILGLLRRLQLDLGMSMLIISHDLAAVRQVTDRLVVMYRGRIVEVGATDDVIDRPRDPYTVRLVQASTSRSETER